MKTSLALGCLVIGMIVGSAASAVDAPLPPMRPPAVPLVAHDPYFSNWSFSDNLNASWPRHWTGQTQAMTAMVRVDGRAYVLMGSPTAGGATAMKQESVEVLPTRTIYTFGGSGVHVTLTFLTPALPQDLDVLSRPVTYINFDIKSADGRAHETAVYFDATGEWVVDKPDQQVEAGRFENDKGLVGVQMGAKDQKVLQRKGDNLRIEWGHLIVAAPGEGGSKVSAIVADDSSARGTFGIEGELPKAADTHFPRAASDNWPVLAMRLATGSVTDKQTASAWLMIGYDDDYSIEYMTKRLRAWWKRDGMSTADLMAAAARDYGKLSEQCAKFDAQLMTDMRASGGEKYARMCALAYRQAMAAHKLVASTDGKTPLYFSKENFSNGCIATVDITYPSAPIYLLLNPTLLKGMTTPILDYAQNSGRWKFPFAPHDLGTYPKANGQVYGGGERTEENQMPVEESGNILILVGALARIDGNADYAKQYWPTLEKWAAYLKEKGLDPENQLCTDDFAGHLAHNTNLSLKAIVALRAFAEVEDMVKGKAGGSAYHAVVKEMAEKWQQMAIDGDHYKLTFDKAGTWSQKYNLVWDKLLKYDLFPKAIREKEIAFYKTKLNKYGLPLDNRKTYTKLDWIFWTATLADSGEDFRAIMEPCYTWANETTSRVPMTDWYDTVTGRQSGFQARSVVGGLFIKMLDDEAMWKKYAKAGQ